MPLKSSGSYVVEIESEILGAALLGASKPMFVPTTQMRHYVDGRQQPLPAKGTFLPQMGQIVSMRIGRDIEGKKELEGLLDEMRISDIVRYTRDFMPLAENWMGELSSRR